MLIKKPEEIKSSEITDELTYRRFLNRRNFIRAGILGGSTLATGWLFKSLKPQVATRRQEGTQVAGAFTSPEGEAVTPFEDITNYNNFYEFSTSKQGPATRAKGFVSRPWTVEVTGRIQRPRTFDLDDLLKIASLEDRVYRLRCVEAWSMVIPWLGFPLERLLREVEPLGTAKFVKFLTLLDPKRMPNQGTDVLPWPYVEGLRLDEAMHPLTILSAGLYGKMLLPQNGAPIRLVVPWKYGFKSIKSIVRIELTSEQPNTTWSDVAPSEYGFYSNVNPSVDHPRWSQATERRIGEFGLRKTVTFNGYGDQVAHLYDGLNLETNF
jgi:methionine sulfoxide reductase catalytic subunit